MTTVKEFRPVLIGGRMILVSKPSEGQYEALARISRTIARGTDDDQAEFWSKQVDRIGTLMESLIAEDEVDIVDQMVLTGKTTMSEMLKAILGAWDTADDKPTQAKASANRVKRK
jgi:hypothetical protein